MKHSEPQDKTSHLPTISARSPCQRIHSHRTTKADWSSKSRERMAEDGGVAQSESRTGDPPVVDEVVFRENISGWVARPKDERIRSHFYFLLDGAYSAVPGALSFQAMTSRSPDHGVVSQLTRVTADLDVEIFLVLLEREPGVELGDEGAEETGEPKTQFLVRQMVDLEGHPYVSDYPIDESQFYQHIGPRPEMSLGPDRYEGAVLLITRDSLAQFFLDLSMFCIDNPLGASRSCSSLRLALKYLADKCVGSEGQGASLTRVLRELVVGTLIKESKFEYAILTDHDFLPVQNALLRARDWDTLEQVVIQTGGRLGVAEALEVGILVRGGHVSIEDVEKWMLACIVHAKSIRAKCARLSEFFRGLEGSEGKINDEHRQWVMTTFDNEVLQKPQEGRLSVEDGNEVLTLVLRLFELGEATVNYSLLALADKYPAQGSFMIGLLVRLNKAIRSSTTSCPPAKKLFLELAERTLKHLDISKFCTSSAVPMRSLLDYTLRMPKKQNLEDTLVHLAPSDPEQMLILDHGQLAEFITALLQQKVGSAMLRQLSIGIIAKAPLIHREQFTTLWLPFLQKLIGVLETFKIPLSKPRWSHIFAAIFDAFIDNNKGPKPEVMEWLWNANLREFACRCVNCKNLAEFLCFALDKTQLTGKGTPEGVAHIKHFVLDRVTQKTACEYDVQTQVLVIRKVGSYTEKTEREWAQAAEEVKRQVRRFDEEKLRQILGFEFSSIWNAESLILPEAPVKLPPTPVLPQEQAPGPVQAPPPLIQTLPYGSMPAPGHAPDSRQPDHVSRLQANALRETLTGSMIPQREPSSQRNIASYFLDRSRNSQSSPNVNPIAGIQPKPRLLTGLDVFMRENMPPTQQENPGLSGNALRVACSEPWTRFPQSLRNLYEQQVRRENLEREIAASRLKPAPPPPPSPGRPLARNLPGIQSIVADVLRAANPPRPESLPSLAAPTLPIGTPPRIATSTTPLISTVGRAPPARPSPSTAPQMSSRATTARHNPPEIIVLDDEDETPPDRSGVKRIDSTSSTRPPPLNSHPTTPAPKPESTTMASSATPSSTQSAPAPSGSAEAYANYEVEMAPRLRKKYPHLGQDSIKRAMRRSWEKMTDRDRDSYKKEVTCSRPVKVKTEAGSTPKPTATQTNTATPLQATSANSQRTTRTSSGSLSKPFKPYGASARRSGSLSAGSSLKRKYAGSESSGRESTRPRRATRSGLDEATEAGNLYYPPIRPPGSSPSTPASASASRKPTAKGGYGAWTGSTVSSSTKKTSQPITIDLTLDD